LFIQFNYFKVLDLVAYRVALHVSRCTFDMSTVNLQLQYRQWLSQGD
jgi:hypothetical protein